ncbi:Condensin-2 complex subunit D3 [Dirofilaria immitis]|nr:Condensin-2 complex subunit D3 [Dirofilaria immitis]
MNYLKHWMIFEDNFSDFGSFAHAVQFSILQAFDYSQRLAELCFQLLMYAEKTNSSTEIWHKMVERNFDAKKLCVFAWYLIERGQQSDVGLDDRKVGLIGSRIYISLCCLNGAQAFKIFNDYLFQRALEEMQLIRTLLSNGQLSSIHNRVEINGDTRSKKKKPLVANNSRREQTDFERLTLEDETELRYMLGDVLDSLFVFLNRGPLASTQQSLLSLARLRAFSDRSFALMHCCLNNRHSASGVVYGRIVMPRLLLWTLENTVFPTNAHPPKLMNTYKEAMLSFIRIRIEKGYDEEIFIILLLLQNVCFRCPDRSDYRTKVASSVVEVLAYLPPTHIRDFAVFLLLTGANSKVAVRGFVIEIAVPFIKQYGHILQVTYEQENVIPANTIKEETYNYDEMENDVPSNEEISMEVDEANEDDVNNRQKARKKTKKKQTISNDPIRETDLYHNILVLLLRSCNDKSPLVRTRALMQIAVLLNDENMRSKLLNLPEKTSVYAYNNEDEVAAEKHQNDPVLVRIIATRCLDARASTRKAAIAALESLFSTTLSRPSILVRKQAAESLSRLLLSLGTNSSTFDKAWLASVLPLINDREQSVVQLASKLILETLILPALEDTTPVVWRILEAVEQEASLLRSLLHQAKEGELTERAVESLLKNCSDSKNVTIIWMLLNFLSSVFKIDESPAIRFWYTLNENDGSNLVGYVAEVIARSAEHISETNRNELIEDFSTKLIEFSVNEIHIAHIYYAFARLRNGVGNDSEGTKQILAFNRILVDKSLKILHSVIFRPIDASGEVPLFQENDKITELLVRIIISLGEAIQYSPILLSANPKAFDIMQLIMASDVIQQQLIQTGTSCNILPAVPLAHPSAAVHYPNLEGFVKQEPQVGVQQDADDCNVPKLCASATGFLQSSKSSSHPNNNVERSQKAFASVNQECRTSQPTSHGLGPTFLGQHAVNMEVLTPAVRAQAVLAIGKMCLQDEKLAKKCVPVLSRQLLVNSNHLVRSNIVGVICDLCKRYTLLVDRHSAIIASCLKDSSTLVRKQTLMLLTHLIKEQFVRWAGQIMYRFVSTILDENKEIREYAEMCLVDVLLVQFPNMFVNHFLECVFISIQLHTVYGWRRRMVKAIEDDTAERQDLKCSLSGFRLKNARMRLYRFMIKTFNDENKFTIGMRIGQEVYSAIVDGVLNICDHRVKALLEDCYEIMCCSEMKLSMALGRKSPNEADDDDDEPPSNVQEAARKVVTQAFRKGIIDAILPHIIQLKYYLQERRLPELEFGIIRVLRELCKDHREQLDEFLASDKQLKAEIKFDLEKLEEKERRIKVPNNNNIIAKVPFSKNKRISFNANGAIPSPRPDSEILKQRCEAGMAAQTEMQSEQDAIGDVLPTDSVNGNNRKLTGFVEGQTTMADVKRENVEIVQPSTSIEENFISAKTIEVKRRSPKIRFQQSNEESELPMRAVSTPQHNIGEKRLLYFQLTFGLDNEISAIESTPNRKRSKRRTRQPYAPAIKEADNENE